MTEWAARSEAEAKLAEALEAVDGFPVPESMVEVARRVIEQLAARDYRLAPVLARRRTFVPAVAPGPLYPWIWSDSGAIASSESPNNPPPGGRWRLLYVEEIEEDRT